MTTATCQHASDFSYIALNKRLSQLVVFLYVFSLPYDSFPYPFDIGGSLIKPLALPIALFLLPAVLMGLDARRVNKSVFLIILFCAYTLLMLVIFTFAYDFRIKQTTVPVHSLKGLLSIFSLFAGILIVYQFGRGAHQNYVTLIRYGYYAVFLPLIAGVFQILVILFGPQFFMPPVRILSFVFLAPQYSLVDKVNRVMLLTLEPSVAAMQLILFIIPVLLLYRSIHPTKKLPKFLLALSVIELVFTFSALALLWIAVCLIVLLCLALKDLLLRFRISKLGLSIFTLAVLLLLSSVFFLKDYFGYQKRKLDFLLRAGLLRGTDTRLANAITGLNVFVNENPITGVGLSMLGFFYAQNAPDFVRSYPEGIRYSDLEDPMFPTAKNIFVRLLAETGLIGFSIFLAFLIRLFRKLKKTSVYPAGRLQQTIYKLFLLSFCVCSLNTDSLLHFYIWFIFGLLILYQCTERHDAELVKV